MTDSLKILSRLRLRSPTLVIGWNGDACELGAKVTSYLNRKLRCQIFCEIDPADFFPMSGVTIEDNLIQFPESRFYACPHSDMVLFLSHQPVFEWYEFLNLILDVAAEECHVKEIYAIGGMVLLGAHTTPRQLFGVFSSEEQRNMLMRYNIVGYGDYETPHGQRPTLNSFLLWMAKKKGIPTTNLWVPIPYYLAPTDDPRASKTVLQFIDQRLNLSIDFDDLDKEIEVQNRRLAELRKRLPEIDDFIRRLEVNLAISDEESQKLVIEVNRFLRSEDY